MNLAVAAPPGGILELAGLAPFVRPTQDSGNEGVAVLLPNTGKQGPANRVVQLRWFGRRNRHSPTIGMSHPRLETPR